MQILVQIGPVVSEEMGDLSVCGYILVKLAFNPRKTRRIL
jgi:hypothetical protein